MLINLNDLTTLAKIRILEYIERNKNTFPKTGDFKTFLINTKFFTNPQSYGIQIQNKWMRMFGYKSIAKSKNRGDYKDTDEYVEFKVSYLSNNTWSIVQLRPYQDVDRYDIMLIDNKYNHILYKIPSDKMKSLIDKYGDVAHGTKESNSDNKNIEYRITIKKNMLYEITPFISDTTIVPHKFF